MYRERCRSSYSATELKRVYERVWSFQDDWEDHRRRLVVTEKVAERTVAAHFTTAADLSCGDAYWTKRFPNVEWTLGDFAPGYEYRGPIEQTIEKIDPVDVFFCCETLEHLDDPDYVLQRIRLKTERLVLSTPKLYQYDENPEHYWAWDDECLREMLTSAGFQPFAYEEANGWNDSNRCNGYAFQIWGCK